MAQRIAEIIVRPRRFGPKVLLRVDLHGVSQFGPKDQRTLLRWEWIESIDIEDGCVVCRSSTDLVSFPAGAFGHDAVDLARLLDEGRAITRRPEIIGELSAG